ncbi:unnamed protein product [Rhizoctonia solani]|uniref:Uncharacterized protein n=1 Tax=Rhizoctonia solani TaxID=456999 RepID=A0A8H3GD81_9AGAM|nr:unnamed protein product [Rhizoctonia solani]
MFSKSQVASILLALFAATAVNAHGAIVAVKGENGVNGQAFGIVESTPRDGTRRNPFQVSSYLLIRATLDLELTYRTDGHIYHP